MAIFDEFAKKTRTKYKNSLNEFEIMIPISRVDAIVYTDGDNPIYLNTKLDEIEGKLTPDAEANVPSFGSIDIKNNDQLNTLSATIPNSTIEFEAGENVSLIGENNKITINATDTITTVNGQSGDVVLTYTDVNAAPVSHIHGNINNDGLILNNAVNPTTGDFILISDNSNSHKLAKGIGIGTDTTKYLRNDGTWVTPPDTNTTYDNVTPTTSGLMSPEEHSTLKTISETYVTQTQFNNLSSSIKYPVTSVNNKVGSVTLTYTDVNAAPTTHNHAATDIDSGIFSIDRIPIIPITKGGTGATSAAGAISNFGITATIDELNLIKGATSNIQAQLDNKEATGVATEKANEALASANAYTDTKVDAIIGSDGASVTMATLAADIAANKLAIQNKQNTITGAASTIVNNNLLSNRVVVSNADGKLATSTITTTKLGYLNDVTANIQDQLDGKEATGVAETKANEALASANAYTDTKITDLDTVLNGKQNTITGGATTIIDTDLIINRALISNGDGKIDVSEITSDELNYLDGTTSNIQGQLDNLRDQLGGKSPTSHTHTNIVSANGINKAEMINDYKLVISRNENGSFKERYGFYMGGSNDISSSNMTILRPNTATNIPNNSGHFIFNTVNINNRPTNNANHIYDVTLEPAIAQSNNEGSPSGSLGTTWRPWHSAYLNTIYSPNGIRSTSDERLKTDISEDFTVLKQLFNKLKPISYKFCYTDDNKMRIGFRAQDVESALSEVGIDPTLFGALTKEDLNLDAYLIEGETVTDNCYLHKYLIDGKIYTLNYSEFTALNTYMIQDLQKQVDSFVDSIGSPVVSVNGKTGIIELSPSDINAAPVDHTHKVSVLSKDEPSDLIIGGTWYEIIE